jgi:1,4-dihydroxy-2-naphthoate octaprenyltransferase
MDLLQTRFRDKASEMLQAASTILVALGRGVTFSIETCYYTGTSAEIFCIVKPNLGIIEAVRDDAQIAFAVNQGFPNHMLQGTGRGFFLGGLDQHPHVREQVLAKTPDATPFLTTIRNLGVLQILPDQIAITDDANLGLGPRMVYVPDTWRVLPDRRGRWMQAMGSAWWFLVLMPVVVAGLLALTAPVDVSWRWLIPLLAAALFLQTATTMLTTYTDSRHHLDRRDSPGTSRVLVEGLLPAPHLFWAGIMCLAGGVLLGLLLAMQRGTPVVLLGMVGVLGTLLYAGWPVRLPYGPIEDAVVFLCLGPVAMFGTWFVLTRVYHPPLFLLAPALGLFAEAILHAVHLSTFPDNATSKRFTAAVLLGWEGARWLYVALTTAPYLLVLSGLLAGWLPGWTWLTFASLPLTGRGVVLVWRTTPEQAQDLSVLPTRTTHAYLAFGLSLSLGLLLGAML